MGFTRGTANQKALKLSRHSLQVLLCGVVPDGGHSSVRQSSHCPLDLSLVQTSCKLTKHCCFENPLCCLRAKVPLGKVVVLSVRDELQYINPLYNRLLIVCVCVCALAYFETVVHKMIIVEHIEHEPASYQFIVRLGGCGCLRRNKVN